MNGRCATDPLDLAVDVCDRCYGEFCSNHLVKPKGRRHPLCSNCALEASGVRGSAKLELLGSRRTAKKRRADLKAANANGEQVFQFFDHEDADADPGQVFSDTSSSEAEGLADDETDAGNEEVPPTPAMTKLEELRRETRLDPTADATPPAPVTPDEDDAVPHQLRDDTEAGPEPRLVPPPPPPEFDIEPEPTSPAAAEPVADIPEPVELAPQPARTNPAPEPEDRPQPQPEPVVAIEPEPEAAKPPPSVIEISPVAEQHPDPADQPGSPDRAPGALPLPNRHTTIRPPERRATDSSGTSKPDRRRELPPPTHRRPTAPMIGEVRNVTGRRADDAPATPEPSPEPVVAAAPAPKAGSSKTLNAIEAFDAKRPTPPPASQAETETEPVESADVADSIDEDQSGGRADVDKSGNWIPPILRGFAPDAAEAKSELPQRRG